MLEMQVIIKDPENNFQASVSTELDLQDLLERDPEILAERYGFTIAALQDRFRKRLVRIVASPKVNT